MAAKDSNGTTDYLKKPLAKWLPSLRSSAGQITSCISSMLYCRKPKYLVPNIINCISGMSLYCKESFVFFANQSVHRKSTASNCCLKTSTRRMASLKFRVCKFPSIAWPPESDFWSLRRRRLSSPTRTWPLRCYIYLHSYLQVVLGNLYWVRGDSWGWTVFNPRCQLKRLSHNRTPQWHHHSTKEITLDVQLSKS